MTAKSEAEKDELALRLDAVEYLATSRSFRAGSFLDQSIRVGTKKTGIKLQAISPFQGWRGTGMS